MSLDAVFARNKRRVVGLAAKILGSSDAEDAYQDAVIRALEAAGTFAPKDDRQADTWFYSIALNVCRNRLQYAGRECRGGTVRLPEGVEEMLPARDGESEEVKALKGALNRLPPDQSEILRKMYNDNLSHREIAAELGIAEGAARVRLHRAMEALRRLMKKEVA